MSTPEQPQKSRKFLPQRSLSYSYHDKSDGHAAKEEKILSEGQGVDDVFALSPSLSSPNHTHQRRPLSLIRRSSYELSGAMNRLSTSLGTGGGAGGGGPSTTPDLFPDNNKDDDALADDVGNDNNLTENNEKAEKAVTTSTARKKSPPSKNNLITSILGQVPAIALIALFHLMIGIPFGVSYFPIYWSPHVDIATDSEGPFPIPGKEALGIRMFLFSTIISQLVFTLQSRFKNPIGLQMVRVQKISRSNVSFCILSVNNSNAWFISSSFICRLKMSLFVMSYLQLLLAIKDMVSKQFQLLWSCLD